ncbi:MAG: M24 family metallopeptidase, partial [Actinomycetia bacterium]|nr:M24 family metallopeptidase [Actinomycetes bacterium]
KKEKVMSLPDNEYKIRIDKVKKLAQEKNLDFVFVYFDEYNVMNGRYLTGWCPTIERGAAIISNYCEPFLIGGPEAQPYAQMESSIKKTESSLVFMVPEEEYPGSEILDFSQISKKNFGGRKIKKIGLVGIQSLPLQIYNQLAGELNGVEIVDVTKEFEIFRYVKSQWEIEMCTKAYKIADAGFKKLKESIIEGKKEYEAAAEAEYIGRKMGAEGYGYRTIIGTAERSSGIVTPSSDRIFKNGEIVLAGFAPRFNGYNATACYPVVVGGKPDKLQDKFTKDICQALYLTKEAFKPGLTGKEIDLVPRKFLNSKGYEKYMIMPFVHSSGLCEFERPFFGPGSNDVIQENQVICVDIALFGHDEIPGIRVETAYRITKTGSITFSPYMEKLFGF